MSKLLKITLIVIPWVGMFIFGFYYLGAVANLAAADHYSSQTFNSMEVHQKQLTSFIKSRRDYATDKLAFHSLELILPDQYDGKYEPWLSTKMGLIKFDTYGFIVAVCSPNSGLNNPECPPQL